MKGTRKLRAGIYARQSHGSAKSIVEQTAECTTDAQAQGYRLVATYEDSTSASRYAKKTRPDHGRLLADLAAGKLDVVVMWESSRGDRTLESWAGFLEVCRTQKVAVRVTVDRTTYDLDRPRHWRTLAEDGVDNAYESEKIRHRNLRGARTGFDAGRPNGPTPYGYRRRYHPTSKALVAQEPEPAEAAAVAEVFARVAAGEPLVALAAELQARPDAPPPGAWRKDHAARWTPNAIRGLVRRKAYIGRRSHNGSPSTTVAVWPALVDAEVFHAANRVLDERAGRYWRASRAEHVLTGIPRCLPCEAAGRDRAVYAGSNDARLGLRYQCRSCGKGLPGPDLEDWVLAYVLGRLAEPDVYRKLRRAGETADAEVAAAEADVKRLTGELADWRRSAYDGRGTTPESLAAVETGLSEQIRRAQQRADRAGIPPAVRTLVDAGDALPQVWADMPLPTRRDVVGTLVDVTVSAGERGRRLPVRERVSIEWKGTAGA